VVSNDQHPSILLSGVAAEPAAYGPLLRLMDVLLDIARNDQGTRSTSRDIGDHSTGTAQNRCSTPDLQDERRHQDAMPPPRERR
jgi:hypothetical protein